MLVLHYVRTWYAVHVYTADDGVYYVKTGVSTTISRLSTTAVLYCKLSRAYTVRTAEFTVVQSNSKGVY